VDKHHVAALLPHFAGKRILVIGDLMLDEFIWGKVSRISPEAPVPVVEVLKEECFPGGAANVARSLAEFTDGVRLMGVTGVCRHAERLRSLLTENRIDVAAVQRDPAYSTIVKTRVIARNQHVVRIDREVRTRLRDEHVEAALAQLEAMLPDLDAVIVEDYGKGLLTQHFAGSICSLVASAGKILAVDPNPNNPLRWDRTTMIKPNRLEAYASAGVPFEEHTSPPLEDAALRQVGAILMQKWGTENLLITLGEQGMLLFRPDAPPFHVPTRAREVFDVSGAGDTVIALFTLALSAGATPPEAAEIANHASGVVVGKLGTAAVSAGELLASFDP
jgi:rfaE bifunctional protein kinase chain/domain